MYGFYFLILFSYFRNDFELKFEKLLATIKDLLPKKRCQVIIDLSRNSEEEETKLLDIKEYICKAVLDSTKKNLPAKWMKHEHTFEIIKSETPFISIDNLLKIFDEKENGMLDVEIHDMLSYFHKNGSILFFNLDKLREIIILDIQWFVDCFKDIITDKEHAKEGKSIVNKDVQEKWDIFFGKGLLVSSLYEYLLNRKLADKPQNYREVLGKYLQQLGMMFYIRGIEISDKEETDAWYVPCVNTQEFKPVAEKYDDTGASSILSFRFDDYLPIDLFGRMIVLCLSSGKWHPVGRRFYKEGAHMFYYDKNKSDPLEVYLFTARRIITVQVLNRSTTKQHGKGVKAEIQNIIQELLANLYACSRKFTIGFLCCKREGYRESSVEHFVPMIPKSRYCEFCQSIDDAKRVREETSDFWKVLSREESKPSNGVRSKEKVSLYLHIGLKC